MSNTNNLSTCVDAIDIAKNIQRILLSFISPENCAAINITVVPATHNAEWSVKDPLFRPWLINLYVFVINNDSTIDSLEDKVTNLLAVYDFFGKDI